MGRAVSKHAEIISQRRTWWLLALIGWSLFGAIIGTVTYVRILRFNPAVPWWPPFLNSVFSWGLWAFCMPLVFKLGELFRISRQNLVRNSLFHLFFSVLLCTGMAYFHTLVGATLYTYLNNETFWFAWGNFGMPEFLYYRVPWLLSIYWMLLGVGYAIEYYQESQERKIRSAQLQSQLSETRLGALRQQLQPHFLFNSLHSAVALIQSDRKEAAINMLTRLSDLLRYSVDRLDSHEVTLREELDVLQMYVDTEQERFSDRLSIKMDIDKRTNPAYVPCFLLQPLVENAIRHGIEKKAGPGLIKISSSLIDDKLQIEIRDNGRGASQASEDPKEGRGIGLSTTRSRLALLYKEMAFLSLNSSKGEGTSVILSIPFHTRPVELSLEEESDG